MLSASLKTLCCPPIPFTYWCCTCQDFHRMQFTMTTGQEGRVINNKTSVLMLCLVQDFSASSTDVYGTRRELTRSVWECWRNFVTECFLVTESPKVRSGLTGYLLDLVDHHEGIGQAHLHRVIDRADLRHLSGNLQEGRVWSVRAMMVWLGVSAHSTSHRFLSLLRVHCHLCGIMFFLSSFLCFV